MSVTSLSVVLVLCFDVIFCGDIDNFRNFSCPTWLFSSEDRCICGSSLNMLIMCNNETQGVQVLWGFCLTSSENLSMPVVGRCLLCTEDAEHKYGTLCESQSKHLQAG